MAPRLQLPPHQIKLNFCVSYNFDKVQDPRVGSAFVKPSRYSKKEDNSRTFFVTFSGPPCEGKSPPLLADSNIWRSEFEVNVDLPLVNDILTRQLEVFIFETVKVAPVTKSKSTKHPVMGNPKFTLAATGLTEAQARLKRARQLHSKDVPPTQAQVRSGDVVDVSEMSGAHARIESARDNATLKGSRKTTFEPAFLPDNTQGSESKLPVSSVRPSSAYSEADDSDVSRDGRRHNTPPPVRYSPEYHANKVPTRISGTHGSSKGKTLRKKNINHHRNADDGKETPHPHHYDHPERHILLASTSMKRSRSGASLSDVAAIHTLRPRTPPQPHHADHPMTVLFPRGRAESPKTKGNSFRNYTRPPPKPGITGEFDRLPAQMPKEFWNSEDGPGDFMVKTHNLRRKSDVEQDAPESGLSKALDALGLEMPMKGRALRVEGINDKSQAAALLDPEAVDHLFTLALKDDKQRKDRRGKFAVDVRHVLVGRLRLDLSGFILREVEISEVLEHNIDGLNSLAVTVSTDQYFLSSQQEEMLNPLAITLKSVCGMPDQPVPFQELDRLCYPTMALFQFYSEPRYYEACRESTHAKNLTLNSRNIILTGLIDGAKLRDYFTRDKLTIEIHDRQLRILNDEDSDEQNIPRSPYGVAYFDLSEICQGHTTLELASPVLPSKRDSKKSKFPPGLWLQSGAVLSIRVHSFHPLQLAPSEDNGAFDRIVIISRPQDEKTAYMIEDLVDEINGAAMYVHVTDKNIRHKALLDMHVTEEQLSFPQMDVITGFSFADDEIQIYMLEGVSNHGSKTLTTAVMRTGANVVIRTSHKAFGQRAWSLNTLGIHHVVVRPSLQQLIHSAKTYLMGHLPFDCYNCLIQLYKCIDPGQEYLQFTDFPSLKMVMSLIKTFGDVVQYHGFDAQASDAAVPLPCDIQDNAATNSISTRNHDTRKRIEDRNSNFEKWISDRAGTKKNWIQEYKTQYPSRTLPRARSYHLSVFNYSIQNLSTTEKQMSLLRSTILKNKTYYYSSKFNLPLEPINSYTSQEVGTNI